MKKIIANPEHFEEDYAIIYCGNGEKVNSEGSYSKIRKSRSKFIIQPEDDKLSIFGTIVKKQKP
jgi:hypothetical protein